MNLPVNEITAAERRAAHPNQRPRDAATLILLEHRAGVPHVLMGRRSKAHVFYPDAFVFPGGRVDRSDGAVPTTDAFPSATAARLTTRLKGRASARRARAFAMAAIRETFEETGILIGRAGPTPRWSGCAEWRAFLDHGVAPALEGLAFIARAITPPRRSRRFDARFFAADADVAIAKALPLDQRPSQELSELVWLPLPEALELPIPSITQTVIGDVQARLEAPGGLLGDAPVPFYHEVRGTPVREFV